MKSLILVIAIVMMFICISCEESFSPKAPFIEQYVLNCIIRSDSVSQVAILSKTYDVTGFDPNANNNDPSVSGAQVYLKWKGKLYQMRDSSITRTDTSRYKGPIKFYYTNAVKPTFNDSLEITAIPAPGVLLSAKTKVPYKVFFGNSPSFIKGDELALDIDWTARDLGLFFLPRMKILYQKRNEVPVITHSFEVPINYSYANGIEISEYPGISPASSIEFSRANLDKAMLKISDGDNKLNY